MAGHGKGLSVSASRADPGAAGSSGQSSLRPTPKAESENQTGRLRKRHDQRDEDTSGAGNGFAAEDQGPNLAGRSEGGEESAPRKGKTPDLTLNFLLEPSHETKPCPSDPSEPARPAAPVQRIVIHLRKGHQLLHDLEELDVTGSKQFAISAARAFAPSAIR